MDRSKETFVDRLLGLGGPLLLTAFMALCATAYAASPVLRSEDYVGDCVLSVTNTAKPVLLSTAGVTSCSAWSGVAVPRNEFCIVNENITSTNTVRISTFSTVDSTIYGWPIRGTEKECHDWGQNISVWIWRDTSNPNQTVTIRVTK